MSPTAETVIEKLDELLKDDKNFSTRSGLRFMTSIMKEALIVIAEAAQDKSSINTRLQHVESALNEFLKKQEKKEVKAEEERSKWRWAIITPTIGMLLIELFRWLSNR